MTVCDSVDVPVDPPTVYDVLADPRQMGRFSPENTGASLHAELPLREGSMFDGRNARGRLRWTTRCVVTSVRRGEEFALRVERWGLGRPALTFPIATWRYVLEPTGRGPWSGCETS